MFLQQLVHLAAERDIPAARTLKICRARFRRGHLQGFKENFSFSHISNHFSWSLFGVPSLTRRHFGGNHATRLENIFSPDQIENALAAKLSIQNHHTKETKETKNSVSQAATIFVVAKLARENLRTGALNSMRSGSSLDWLDSRWLHFPQPIKLGGAGSGVCQRELRADNRGHLVESIQVTGGVN